MTTFTRDIREATTWSIVLSVLMMICGMLAVLIPPVAGLAVTMMFGWVLLFAGALHIGFAWRADHASRKAGEAALAALYIGIGLYLLARPVAGLVSLTLVIAAYLVAKGVLEGAIAFKLRPLPGSGCLLFDGVVTIAIAVMIAASWPASSAWVAGVLVGIALFTSGLARLMMSVAVRHVLA